MSIPVATEPLTLGGFLDAVEIIDANLDANTSSEYLEQPLARTWARVAKVAEESGEVIDALIACTGENFRKGVCGTQDDLLAELGDTASAAVCAIQHFTKDADVTWAVVSAALLKARSRCGPAMTGGTVAVDFGGSSTPTRKAGTTGTIYDVPAVAP